MWLALGAPAQYPERWGLPCLGLFWLLILVSERAVFPGLTINRQVYHWVADNGLFVGRPKDL